MIILQINFHIIEWITKILNLYNVFLNQIHVEKYTYFDLIKFEVLKGTMNLVVTLVHYVFLINKNNG